jgi:hypothetical protein
VQPPLVYRLFIRAFWAWWEDDAVDLGDEDDRGRHLSRFGEELADAARADPDDHLDELRGGWR